MIKVLDNLSNAFVHIERVPDCLAAFQFLTKNESFIFSNVEDAEELFKELHFFSISFKSAKREKRKNAEAIQLELLLPEGLSKIEKIKFTKEYAKLVLPNMDYAAFFKKKGKGYYVTYLISERTFYPEGIEMTWKCPCNVYKRKTDKGTMVFCSKNHKGAVLVERKGEIRKRAIVKFSNKSREFTGCNGEFEQLIKSLKQSVISIASKFNKIIKRVFIPKINNKKAKGNFYRYKNILDLNKTFSYFEHAINIIENNLLLGYMDEVLPDLQQLKYRILNRARNLRFKYGRVSLSISYKMRRDSFLESLTLLKEEFDHEISQIKEEMLSYAAY